MKLRKKINVALVGKGSMGTSHGGLKGFTRIECVNRYDMPESVFPIMRAPIGWLRGHIHSMYSYFDAVYAQRQPSTSFKDGIYVNKIMQKAYNMAWIVDEKVDMSQKNADIRENIVKNVNVVCNFCCSIEI